MQKKAFLALAVLTVVIGMIWAAGCLGMMGESGQYAPASSGPVFAEEKMVSTANYDSRTQYAVPSPAPYSSATYSGADQKIIRSAYLSLEVKDVQGAMDSLKPVAEGAGGYISSSNMNRDSTGRLYASVTLRVPAAAFESALASVKSIGTVTSSSTSGEDVTEEYVDLNARKVALQNQLDQYNKILAKADKVEDILNVQVQIERVQVELDRIEGRLKYLDNRVDLSTITVNLQEPAPIGSGIGFDVNSVINEAIGGFLGMIGALIILFFALLPLIIIGLVAYVIYRWYKGRKPASVQEPVKQEEQKQ